MSMVSLILVAAAIVSCDGFGVSRSRSPPAGATSTQTTVPRGFVSTRPTSVDTSLLAATLENTAVELSDEEIVAELERAADGVIDEECEVDFETGEFDEEACSEEGRSSFRRIITKTLSLVRGREIDEEDDGSTLETGVFSGELEGDLLERGWEQRGNSSALRRNAEVWKFALKCVFKSLKARKLSKKGASEDEISQAKVEAATFIRDGLLRLGPTFVK
ncbi:hypothetical protein THAOC_12671 [Thalassiosira oceanica]|uniref:RxLR effector protein n=1 Tax=Thalassiosira oceanica TaxID=159749 RepID=K0SM46_THAOC|nr:hypothetical protein THAOC_12671 [Thalassiosira oceanica]|eukprot:EJK66420.1 hypothetical protein THAOC_12671 [Thalassiosira oceanica]